MATSSELIPYISSHFADVSKREVSPGEADLILNSISRELLEEALCGNEDANSFNELAVDILRTLLPSCSKDTVNKHVTLLPLLVERLKASEDQNSISDLSECVICLSASGGRDCSDPLHQTVDALSAFCVKNSQQFPFTGIIERITESMRVLRTFDEHCGDTSYELSSRHDWPKDVLTLLDRFLRTRTEMVGDDTRFRMFRLVKEVVETIGTDWFAVNPSLLVLLVHLVVVQSRICLDKHDTTDPQDIAICFHILEMAIRCVEESSTIEDSVATRMATSIREAAFFAAEFWVGAEEQGQHLPKEVKLVLYRFLLCFLAIGGAEMLPSSLVESCSPLLLDVFKREVECGNHTAALLFLPYLHVLPKLSDNVLTLIVDLALSQCSLSNWKEIDDDAASCLESLSSRVDFYNEESLASARSRVKQLKNGSKLHEVLAKL